MTTTHTDLITAEQFELAVGSPPIQDDLERVNCKLAGRFGHEQCGWDRSRNMPRFVPGPRQSKTSGTYTDLIESAQAIGAIAESAGWYTQRLAERIGRSGKTVDSLSVCELVEIDRELRAEVQRAYGEAMA